MTRASFAVIGDVHGESERLNRALRLAQGAAERIVLLGDYVDRGPNSFNVLEALAEAVEVLGPRLILLRGNHEVALLRFLDSGDRRSFLHHGGLTTVRSYRVQGVAPLERFRETFPKHHRELLDATVTHFEDEDMLISHCGYDPLRPTSRAESVVSSGHFPEIFRTPAIRPRPLVVCGHYVQRKGVPFVSPSLICIDTGCGTTPEAPLAVLSLPDRRIWTV
jgi:serine/threonine protein phosphatase 1